MDVKPCLSLREEQMLRLLENRVLRIFEPKSEDGMGWDGMEKDGRLEKFAQRRA
jgi:hypothetical protein